MLTWPLTRLMCSVWENDKCGGGNATAEAEARRVRRGVCSGYPLLLHGGVSDGRAASARGIAFDL